MRLALPLVFALLCLRAPAALADAAWFESGDALLRSDLLLLNDAEVITLPVMQWPIPRAAVRHAMSNAKRHFATNAAVDAAIARVQARLDNTGKRSYDVSVTGGHPGSLRGFDTLGREEAELSAGARLENPRFSVGLRVTGVTDADDDQALRLDGSHGTLALGNWLLSAHTLDRWWGPGHESSLILSNNARPMPTVMVERATALPFGSRWLSWLGPWRFSFGISQMEDDREDIDSPLFMAWRITVMPFEKLELGFSRTAQFCGTQLVCDWDSFGNMLAGNDNVGIDATPENEPGNQMAGFDLRWSSPIGNLPYAIYGQGIGEDESSYLPVKYLMQFGIETWKPFSDGALLQTFLEYSNTTCSDLSSSGPYYNCGYNQGRFNAEGYRYRGRVIGHTTDNDAEALALGGTLTTARGDVWSATARAADLNRDGIDVRNTVSGGPARYAALEAGWRGRMAGGELSARLGVESVQPEGLDRDVEPFGFLSWKRDLAP
jgi:hypothetical protein